MLVNDGVAEVLSKLNLQLRKTQAFNVSEYLLQNYLVAQVTWNVCTSELGFTMKNIIKNKIKANRSDLQLTAFKYLYYTWRDWFDPFPYRRYMKRHKCIFIHIPKTAGSSIQEALGYQGPRDHCTYREFRKSNPIRFNNYFKFCFVRNPYSRFISLFKYLGSGGNQGSHDKNISERIIDEGWSINDFCDYVLSEKLFLYHPLFWPQSLYICDHEGNIYVDFVGKIENIENDYMVIRKTLGLSKKLERKNRSVQGNKKYALIAESKVILAEIYARDFDLFKYEK